MKTLESFAFASHKAVEAKYDWTKLLNGKIWELEAGADKDFDCKPETFRMMAMKRCEKEGKKLQMNVTKTGLVLRAIVLTKEELADRAKAKAERKAKKEATPSTNGTPEAPVAPPANKPETKKERKAREKAEKEAKTAKEAAEKAEAEAVKAKAAKEAREAKDAAATTAA